MRVDWTSDPGAFTLHDWTSLVEADPEGTFFHTPRYLKLYWEEFGAQNLEIVHVRRGAEAVAAAALDVRDGVLSWLGGFDVTDYMGPVGAPEDRRAAAAELVRALAARHDWETAELAGLPEEGLWLRDLTEAAGEAGLGLEVGEDGVAPLLQLPDSFEAYLESLPGKLRHEIRRKERRLREAHSEFRLVDATPASITQDLDRFVELHRSSAGEKGRFMVPGMELFFRRLGDEVLEDGTFRLAFLEVDGDRIAGAVGFRWGDRFLLYNSAYDHQRSSLAPGMILVAELIRSTIEEGLRLFDFLKGDVGYKYRFGPRPRRVARLLLHRQ